LNPKSFFEGPIPVADDLTQIRERIEVGRDDIVSLTKEIETFIANAITHRSQQSVSKPTYDLFVTQTKPIPTALLAHVGSTVHAIRAPLDALACQLAIRNGNDITHVLFPISKSKESFEKDGMKKIQKLSASDRAVIIALKPYREENSTLFSLHQADLQGKHHQRLVGCVGQNSQASIGGQFLMSGGSVTIVKWVKDGKIIAEDFSYDSNKVSLSDIGRESCLATNVPNSTKVDLSYSIVYAEPKELAGKDVCAVLKEFADAVDAIIAKFE
jgi:hypothetical protein